MSQENSERERQEQRRAERERENVEKRRSLALCGVPELGREPDDLERTLERNLSCTWSRRSIRRYSQTRVTSQDCKSSDSDSKQQLGSENQDFRQVLSSEGYSRNSGISSRVLSKDNVVNTNNQSLVKMDTTVGECRLRKDSENGLHRNTDDVHSSVKCQTEDSSMFISRLSSDGDFSSPEKQQQGATEVSPHTGMSPTKVLKVERQVYDVSERLADVSTDVLEEVGKQERTDAAKASSGNCLSEGKETLETDSETSGGGMEIWPGSCPPEVAPQLAQEPEPASSDRERAYPRVGETVECHTLVKGLRSYESLSPAGPRPAPSHCSKWRKELEAEERDGASSPQAKEDPRAGKSSTRVPSKRGMTPRSLLSNSTGLQRVRAKAESSRSEGPSTPRASRLNPPRTSSMRLSPITRPTNIQSELKRSSSTRDKSGARSDVLLKQDCRPAEKAGQDREKVLPGREPFIRGSPLRVSKRLASNFEPQSPSQTRTVHSPTAATNAKTIRTAVINAAKVKSAKNAETASTKATPGTRSSGPKIPRPAVQPMWR